MAITPADIEQLTFSESKHGYDTEEVDGFLEQLAGEVDAMLQKIADLKGRLNTSESQLAAAQAEVAQLKAAGSSSAPAPVAAPVSAGVSSASEHQISQALIVAQQSADTIVAEAKDNADHIREEADQKAREVIRQALAEKQNELDEIDRLKQSREEFRSEYKGLLQHFMDDAEAAFPNQVLTSTPNGSTGTRYDAPTPAPTPSADVNATVYAPMPQQNAAGVNVDDLD
ncbi:MAG: DivIVA domain-containing protein [Atopobiaceae bacterium]|jgi:cell division initiation protein|nr:DivIVA domain-containing protein [Atopobiaceae bacterium]MCI2173373.1 DivIVA domain-containing protein [Atopobiaceae bacterium]MCI2207368.1 DivIVA domain-containing protein [Atopobiaceae bacterium]